MDSLRRSLLSLVLLFAFLAASSPAVAPDHRRHRRPGRRRGGRRAPRRHRRGDRPRPPGVAPGGDRRQRRLPPQSPAAGGLRGLLPPRRLRPRDPQGDRRRPRQGRPAQRQPARRPLAGDHGDRRRAGDRHHHHHARRQPRHPGRSRRCPPAATTPRSCRSRPASRPTPTPTTPRPVDRSRSTARRGAENAFYIDGVNTTGVEYGFQGKELNFEFIQEVDVKTGGYEAEYGRATGGIINVITKSGGNEFHGDVFGYYDNDSLQANPKTVVSNGGTPGGFTSKDYGADLGGYIVKDKLWFFGAYDQVRNTHDSTLPPARSPATSVDSQEPPRPRLRQAHLERSPTASRSSARFLQDPRADTGAINDANHTPQRRPARPTSAAQDFGGRDYALRYDGIIEPDVARSPRRPRATANRTPSVRPPPRATPSSTATRRQQLLPDRRLRPHAEQGVRARSSTAAR